MGTVGASGHPPLNIMKYLYNLGYERFPFVAQQVGTGGNSDLRDLALLRCALANLRISTRRPQAVRSVHVNPDESAGIYEQSAVISADDGGECAADQRPCRFAMLPLRLTRAPQLRRSKATALVRSRLDKVSYRPGRNT